MRKHYSNYEPCGEQAVLPQTIIREIDRLQLQFRQLAECLRGGVVEGETADSTVIDRPEAASEETVRAVIRSRDQRGRFFPGYLFADPAWDMLIDLYAAKLAQHRVSVSSLCIASNVPATTALRWINALEAEGLVVRTSDNSDKRRHFVSLTEPGLRAMDGYFASVSGSRPATV